MQERETWEYQDKEKKQNNKTCIAGASWLYAHNQADY